MLCSQAFVRVFLSFRRCFFSLVQIFSQNNCTKEQMASMHVWCVFCVHECVCGCLKGSFGKLLLIRCSFP